MTSSPQTRQWTSPAQDGRRRTTPASVSAEGSAPARARQTLPAVDPSMVFGCVDWFLYPDQAVGRSASEAQRIPA
jgi:hypothetical protein